MQAAMDSEFSHRILKSRTAAVCRLCLKKRYLMDIDSNQYLREQFLECFPDSKPDDSELPQFVCGECYQLIEITSQFIVRTRRTEKLLRTYMHQGGDFPTPEALEAEYRRASKRSASPEKQEDQKRPHKKRRESTSSTGKKEEHKKERSSRESTSSAEVKEKTSSETHKKEQSSREPSRSTEKRERSSSKHHERKERKSSKQNEKDRTKDSSSKRREKESRSESSSRCKEKERSSSSSKRTTKKSSDTELERYYRSDEFLFGEKVELDPVETRNGSIEDVNVDAAKQIETIASNLPGIPLNMSYNEMVSVLKTIENMQNNQ